jgi:hypothetical protein
MTKMSFRNNYIEIHPTQAQVAKNSYHHPSKYLNQNVSPQLQYLLFRIMCLFSEKWDDKNAVHDEKSDFLGQLTEKIRGCGVSFYIWTTKGTQGELDTYPKKKMKFINDYVFRLNTNKRLSTNTKVILYDIFLQIL